MNIPRSTLLVSFAVAIAVLTGSCAKKPAATTTIQVSSPASATSTASGSSITQTNIAVIESKNTLGRVVDSLGLEAKWGTDREGCIKRLKATLRVQPIKGTDLLQISTNEEDAANIANAIAASYCDIIAEGGGETKVIIHEMAK